MFIVWGIDEKVKRKTEETSNFIFLVVSSVREGRIMTQLQLKETNRLDFCELGKYQDFENWGEFKKFFCNGSTENLKAENHCLFRWDIDEHYNIWTGEKEGYELKLFYIDQKLGEYHSCVVEQITKEDLPELKAYLQKSWKYLQSIWQPFLYREGM